MAKKHLLTFWLLVVTAVNICAQSPKLNGVYIGAQLYTTPFNGMQIDNIVIYFRSDGSLSNTLNRADWKTRVDGSYTISNKTVNISFKNGDESKKYILAANGNLMSTVGVKHTLHKVKKISAIPAGVYEKRSASTSGGIGTGTPIVGAFSSNYLYFDGKGNFSADRSSVVGVSGETGSGTVAGKFDKNSKSGGTYKLGDAEITLTYGNGKVARHSFFYSPPNEEDLILMDGEFYFREENAERPVANNKESTTKTTSTAEKTSAATALPTAGSLLAKLRNRYGGTQIDALSTVKETATLTGNLQAMVITDVPNNRIRAEVRQNGKLLLIKQVEGSQGWQWLNGVKKQLTATEKDELALSLYQGTMGLHKSFNSNFAMGKVTASGDDHIITFYKGKNKLIYLVGRDGSLKGNAYSINGSEPNIMVYKNFTTKGGITYPAVTESSDGKNKLTSTTTAIEFNPVLNGDSWKLP